MTRDEAERVWAAETWTQERIAAAVAEEREACAQVADEYAREPSRVGTLHGTIGATAAEIASAIRARGAR